MAIIKIIEEQNATGKVAEIYKKMLDSMGFIPNAFKIFSSSEHVLESQFNNLNYFFRHTNLSGKLLAFIRLMVSENEKCEYCVGINSGILFQYGIPPEMLKEIIKDPETIPLDDKEKAMLFFVLKIVKNSNSIQQNDMDMLHQLGWEDKEILEATYHGTSQVAADMMFNAFKIDLEK
jgi:uncharacterized peroxidase-related enzyme